MKTGRLFILGLIVMLAACSPAAKTLSVTAAGGKCTLDEGNKLSAGEVTVKWNVKDQDAPIYVISILTLEKGKEYQDLVDFLNTDNWTSDYPPSWSKWQGDMGGKPDSQNEKTFRLEDSPIYLVCFAGTSTTFDLKPIGVLGPIKVVK